MPLGNTSSHRRFFILMDFIKHPRLNAVIFQKVVRALGGIQLPSTLAKCLGFLDDFGPVVGRNRKKDCLGFYLLVGSKP